MARSTLSNEKKQQLKLLFDRPAEPLFVPKGEEQLFFDVPSDYYTDRYKSLSTTLTTRFGNEAKSKISVRRISVPPIDDITQLSKQSPFSVFIPRHRDLASKLINIFLGMRTVDDLISCAAYVHDRVNPFLFNYALSVALLHRPDTQGVDLPNFMESFPEKYLDGSVFAKAREEASVVNDSNARQPIEIPRDFTASMLEEEHRLAYFREDLGINLHHWHWHLVYPFGGSREIVAKDRRGELFYYMHQQVIARYNAERLCNNLSRVDRLLDLTKPIKEGYFPKLDSLIASRAWPARVPNTSLQNLNRPVDEIRQDVEDLKRWHDRILQAIHTGMVSREDGQSVQLAVQGDVDLGIDVLGNMVEASPILSPNYAFYGNIHNMGHNFIAFSHDPDHRYLENFGVMGDSATAMRDPVFYRWHAFIDDLFQQHKIRIPPYSVEQLNFPTVMIQEVQVEVENGRPNELQTFWQQSDVDLSRGMDFTPRGPVLVRFTHLQHAPFVYRIQINNNSNQVQNGTCRIFIGPKVDERGVQMLFREHRLLFIELDKFPVMLNPGSNNIRRRSTESSVTIPFERTFRNLDLNRPVSGDALAQFNFCGCGWPQHMLIPKGTPEGFQCQLFVMVSDARLDVIQQDVQGECNDAASYCGIKDKRYPDRRNMGFPFDRVARPNVSTIEEFLTGNMILRDVRITHIDRTELRNERQRN